MATRRKLSNNKKRKIREWIGIAAAALQAGDAQSCMAACEQIRAIDPEQAEAAFFEGMIAAGSGQLEYAEQRLSVAAEAAPMRAEFLAALAGLYLRMGRLDESEAMYRRVLAIDAHALGARLGLGGVLVRRENYPAAIEVLEQACARHPNDADVRMGLFQACHHAGRIDAARGHLEFLIARDPEHAVAHYSLALLELETGRKQAAETAVRRAIAIRPSYAEAHAVLADLKRFSDTDEDAQAIEALHTGSAPGSIERMLTAFALAKVNDDMGKTDRAFALFEEANSIHRSASPWDEEAEVNRQRAAIEAFTAKCFPETTGKGGAGPIFVIGMPRSGTTLVEQILASHPDVGSCGENRMLRNALETAAGGPVEPAQVAGWAPERCEAAAAAYLKQAQSICPDARVVTDKTLSNVAFVGAMARLFPTARIVHVRRHPMATCWSIFRHRLTGSDFDYGYDLGELGRYYRMHEACMAHWREVLPEDMFIELPYESLVEHQRERTEALLSACGLDWNEACLDFQNSDNRVQTASIMQVRRPMYRDALEAWRRYEPHLGALMGALGDDTVLHGTRKA